MKGKSGLGLAAAGSQRGRLDTTKSHRPGWLVVAGGGEAASLSLLSLSFFSLSLFSPPRRPPVGLSRAHPCATVLPPPLVLLRVASFFPSSRDTALGRPVIPSPTSIVWVPGDIPFFCLSLFRLCCLSLCSCRHSVCLSGMLVSQGAMVMFI